MNNKQQGFEENDTGFYQFIPQENFPKTVCSLKPLQTKNKFKLNFKFPLTLFNSINLTLSPDEDLELNWNNQHNQSSNDQNYEENNEISDLDPLETIIMKPEKEQSLQTFKPQLNRQIVEKVSDVFPKRFICVYNRFHENIFLKCDLTIVVKNIARCIKLQLLKPIDTSFAFKTCKSLQKLSNNENERLSHEFYKQKKQEKRGKRYQNEKQLKSHNESRILLKRADYSSFELQKSMILNHEIRQRINQVEFYSNFESGNLHLVFKDKSIENLFYLFLTNDTNTHGFNQWFYFGVKYQGKQCKKYRFIIMNVSKEFKYDERMRLLTLVNGEWQRKTSFKVYKNKYCRYSGGNLISLDFQYEFNAKAQEITFFSLGYPYTYSRAIKLVKQLNSKPYKNLVVTIETLGKTQLTNYIPVIKIERNQSKKLKQLPKKSTILIMARQHASQTPSSFICQSLIRNLLSQNQQWQSLLNTYNFIIIPMANPDGVIHGNSRTNIKGYDINRFWQPNKGNHTFMSMETQEINNYLNEILKTETIEYTIDLHSHSKEYGSFVYCCDHSESSRFFSYFFTQNYLQCNYEKCKANLSSDKKCTFRGQMYHRFGIKNSFTIETSYYGFLEQRQNETEKLIPFTLKNYQNIANSILYAITQTSNAQKKLNQHKQLLKIIQQLDSKIKVLRRANLLKAKDQNSQSDSDPENEYLQIKERQQNGQNVSQCKNYLSNSSKKANNFSGRIERSQSLANSNKNLQTVSKIQFSFSNGTQTKRKRKRIYTSLGNANQGCIEQSPKEGLDQSMRKKFLTQAEKQIDFRKTLRRGYRMTQSQVGFYRFRQTKKQKQPQKKQPVNCIAYPTSTDLQINSENIRLLHENLFKGRIKVKSIKQQQSKFLKRMGKGNLMTEQKSTTAKNIFQNKIIQQCSQRQINELLNIERIQQVKLSNSVSLKK